jgi:hypothetical protein
MHVIPKLSSWSFLWINSQSNKPPLMISPTSPCGMHPNLQKIPKQCNVSKKVITCENVILVFVPIHQHIHNLVSNYMFSIFMTCTTIHFHFLHKLGLGISWTLNFYSIPTRFNFHLLLDGWVFPNVLNHHFIYTQIMFYIPKLPTQFITCLN